MLFAASLLKKDFEVLEWVQRRAEKLVKLLENLSYVEWPREAVIFILGKRRFMGTLPLSTTTL